MGTKQSSKNFCVEGRPGYVHRAISGVSGPGTKRKAATVAELCDLYLADAEAGRLLTRRKAAKKASTIATDKGRIERHIKPLLGTMRVVAVTRCRRPSSCVRAPGDRLPVRRVTGRRCGRGRGP